MSLTEEEITTLKKARTPLKTKLTKFIHFIENDQNKHKTTEINLRLENIKGILEQFETIQSEIDRELS